MKRVINSTIEGKIPVSTLGRLVDRIKVYLLDTGRNVGRVDAEESGFAATRNVCVTVEADDGTFIGSFTMMLNNKETLNYDTKFETLWDMNLDEMDHIRHIFECVLK